MTRVLVSERPRYSRYVFPESGEVWEVDVRGGMSRVILLTLQIVKGRHGLDVQCLTLDTDWPQNFALGGTQNWHPDHFNPQCSKRLA